MYDFSKMDEILNRLEQTLKIKSFTLIERISNLFRNSPFFDKKMEELKIKQKKIANLNDENKLFYFTEQKPPYKIKVFTTKEVNRFVENIFKDIVKRCIYSEQDDFLNDEHSLGYFSLVAGKKQLDIIWKMKYNSATMDNDKFDPLHPKCLRVLEIMTLDEYYERYPFEENQKGIFEK